MITAQRLITVKRPYIHFKGKLYYVHDLIHNPLTQETFVSYQALYPPYEMYTCQVEMFLDEVDPDIKGNIANQKNIFELYTGEQLIKIEEEN